MELLLDGQKMLHSVEVVFHLVEDATDIKDCNCTLGIVLLLGVAAPVMLNEEQVVIKSLETLVRVLLALGTVLTNEL